MHAYLRTLFELRTKWSSPPAMVEWSLPAAQPLLSIRAGSPVTRLSSARVSNSGRPLAFLSFLVFLSSSLSFLNQLSTVLINDFLLVSFTFSIGIANCNFPFATYTYNNEKMLCYMYLFISSIGAKQKVLYYNVCRPILKAIENMSGVDNGSSSFLAFLPQKCQKVGSGENVKVNSDFIQKENL